MGQALGIRRDHVRCDGARITTGVPGGSSALDTATFADITGHTGVQRVVLGSAVYLTVVGLLGVAVGAIVRRAVVGIGAMVFVLFVAPILVTAMSRATSGIGKFLPNYAGGP